MNKKDVTLFWQWFADNAACMDNERRKDTFLAGIDDQVEALGDFAWEIGPGYQTSNMFVLSPHGNKELLKETQSIIEEAPKLTNREFYYAKQPIQAQLKFILYTDNGAGVIAIFPMSEQQQPNQIRIVEIYANKEAYQSHLKTPHFQHYKTSTAKMVKSIKLVDMETLYKQTMLQIFKKLQ